MTRLLTLFSAITIVFSAQASHVRSLEISYKHLGNQVYKIELNFISLCGTGGTVGPPTQQSVYYFCPSSNSADTFDLPLVGSSELDFSCDGSGSLCGSQLFPLTYVAIIRTYADTFDLSGYSSCQDGQLLFGTYARPPGSNYIGQSSMYVNTLFDPHEENSTPSGLGLAQPLLLMEGGQYTTPISTIDPDGDSLVFYLDTAQTMYNTISGYSYLSYNSSISATALDPMPGLTLDSVTGELEISPSILAGFNLMVNSVAWKVEEWDAAADTFKGFTHFESILSVLPDTLNTTPSIDSAWTSSFQLMNPSNMSLGVCTGDTFEIWIAASDADSLDTVSAELLSGQGNLYLQIDSIAPGLFKVIGVMLSQNAIAETFYVRVSDSHCPFSGYKNFPVTIVPACWNYWSYTICQNVWTQYSVYGDSAIWSVVLGDSINSNTFQCSNGGCTDVEFQLSQTTVYSISVLNGGTWYQDTLTVDVWPPTNLGPDLNMCLGDSVWVDANSGDTFYWAVLQGDPIIVGTNFGCAFCQEPWASPTQTTIYVVYSNLSSVCGNVDTLTVFVQEPDDLLLETAIGGIIDSVTYCADETLDSIVAIPSGGIYYGVGVLDSVNGTFSPQQLDPGIGNSSSYWLEYYLEDVCILNDSIKVRVKGLPDATITTLGPYDDTLTFVQLQGVGAYSQEIWSGENPGNPDSNGIFNPSIVPSVWTTIYRWVNDSGCVNEDSALIQIDPVLALEELRFPVVNLMPNPANDYVDIVSESELIVGLSIFDIQGSVLKRIEGSYGRLRLDVGSFSAGVYLIRMEFDDGSSLMRHLIKE